MKAQAKRRFKIGQKVYLTGDRLELPENQFNDLSGVGLVEPVPVPAVKKPEPKKAAPKTRRKRA